MAIEKQIKTKISLRYLDYNTWSAESFKAEKPLKGEVWFCAVPAGNANATTAPTMLFKIGDGVNTFGDLKWGSALAADVYDWAKVAGANVFTKEGTGNVISGIEYDAALNNGKGGFKFTTASVATAQGLGDLLNEVEAIKKDINDNRDIWEKDDNDNTTYHFEVPTTGGNAHKLVISKKEIGETTFTEYQVVDLLTAAELEVALAKYYTKSEIDTKLGDYALKSELHTPTTLTEGAGIEVSGTDRNYTVSHANTSDAVNLTADGRKYVTGLTFDDFGHVTGYTTGSESDQDLSGYKVLQGAYTKELTGAQVVGKVEQTANGNITVTERTLTAADLGLDTVMHFIGAFATAPTKAFEGTGNERELANGDVYLNTANATEYVYSNSKWVELGNEQGAGSHALKTISITGIGYLTGGGTLEADRTIDIDTGVKTKIDHGEEAYGWGNHANAGYAANADLTKVINGTTPVAKATNADDADKLDGHDSTYFATAESVTDITEEGGTIDSKITAYNISKNFGDIITHNVDEFATSDQGGKADTALQEIEAGTGLKVTEKAENKQTIEIDTDVVFILDCNW